MRGPQSAVFGSGAIGGVVNVITQKGGPPQAHVLVEVGGQGTTRFPASTNGASRRVVVGRGVRAARLRRRHVLSRVDRRPNVSNDDYERVVGTAGLGWSDRATRRVRVDTRFGRDERGNPGPYGSDPSGAISGWTPISRGINEPRGVVASAVFGDARAIRHVAQFTWSNTPSTFISPTSSSGEVSQSNDQTRRLMGRYQADFERGRAGFSTGFEFVQEQADNTFVTGSPTFEPIPVDRSIAGLFLEAPMGHRHARRDHGRRATANTSTARRLEGNGFGRPDFDEHVVWSLNPKVSGVWFLRGSRTADAADGWTKIRAGAGTGIKPPTVFELAFTDNPGLKPERSQSFDVSVEHAFPNLLFVADATFFANRYDDLIVCGRHRLFGRERLPHG